MYKKGMIVLVCILALALSGCVAGNSPKERQDSFTWNRRQELIITVTGRRFVVGHEKFVKKMRRVLPEVCCWGNSYSLLHLVKHSTLNRKKRIQSSHTIFMVRPEILFNLEDLEAEYPDLLPVSYENLKSYLKSYSYHFPLLYFSYDSTGKIRGVIIAKKVTSSLAKVLTKGIKFDTLLQYKNGKLKKAEKRKEKPKKTFTWDPKDKKERVIVTVSGRPFVNNHDEFTEEIRKVVSIAHLWGAPSLLYWEGEKIEGGGTRLDTIRSCHTIFMVRPRCLYDLENLEAKYPDLLPVSTEKLKSYLKTYSWPLLYFSLDYTGMLRGVIIAKEVSPSLAKLLTKKPILLDTPMKYENGKLKKLEK